MFDIDILFECLNVQYIMDRNFVGKFIVNKLIFLLLSKFIFYLALKSTVNDMRSQGIYDLHIYNLLQSIKIGCN